MVEFEPKINRSDYKLAIQMLKDFQSLYRQQPRGNGFFICHVNFYTISEYYKLRKNLKKIFSKKRRIMKIIKRMPKHVWLLKEYVFESLFFLSVILGFVVYITQVPIFKGMLPVFISAVIFAFALLRDWIKNKASRLGVIISELIEEIGKK